MNNWLCPVCDATNQRRSEICDSCGCPKNPSEDVLELRLQEFLQGKREREISDRQTGLVFNFYSSVLVGILYFTLAWQGFANERTVISGGRRAAHSIALIGPYSSLLAAIGLTLLGAWFISAAIDAIADWPEGTPYKKWLKILFIVGHTSILLAIYIANRFESISVLSK